MGSPEPTSSASGLRVGAVPGVTLTKWRGIWAERFPRTPLVLSEVVPAEQRNVLDAGTVDMCFVRLPIDTAGLHRIRLYDEVPVVVAPRDHPLAAFDEVSLADLSGEAMIADDLPDAFDRVAWGSGLLIVPHSIARSHSRRDLISRTVSDGRPTTIALAWLVDNANELIDEFIGIVRGRTVNSSRTAAARASRTPDAPAPRPATPDRRRGQGRPARGQRGRRG